MRPNTPFVFALAALALSSAPLVARADAPPASNLKQETRAPWVRSDTRFIRQWLMLSDIPLASDADWTKDWLTEHGGEAAIAPKEKMAHHLANGKEIAWRTSKSWGDAADLSDGNGLKRDVLGYAFTTVHRDAAGPALLCVGSDESVRVWVNGKLVDDQRTTRQLSFDEDQIPVELKAGDNAILVKLAQRQGVWSVAVRVLEKGAVVPRVHEIGPSLLESNENEVVLRTDFSALRAALAPVTVEAVAPGGKIVATKTAKRGEQVRFATKTWPDGAYEFRFVTTRLNGLRYATHTPWYKGDAVVAARALVADASKADAATPYGMTVRMLGDMIVDRLGKDLNAVQGNPWWAVHAPLMEYAELKLEAAGQKDAVARAYGFWRVAYRDEIDGSPQFARVYLPGGYTSGQRWPLVVQIHGYNPANPDYVRWWSADMRHSVSDNEYTNHQGVVYVEPHGRGNTSYLGLGDADVVRVIAIIKKRLSIDEDRVYLRGDSMGGWGTWNVSTRHPELFAAIAPIYGGVDYHSTRSEEELAKLKPLDRFLADKDSSWSMADSLLTTPILVHHGDVDQSVNVDFSRYGVRLLERWGYNVRYREMPGYGHEDLNVMDDIITWFLTHRRNANPARVRLRSAELQHATSYWLRVDQAETPNAFMAVDAEIVGPNQIRLDTQNVLSATLAPRHELIDVMKPVAVVWNGEPFSVTAQNGALVVRAKSYAPAAVEKSMATAGPLGDIFNTPFAIVVGTASSDAAMNATLKRHGDAVAEFWKEWQRQPARYFLDKDLTDADAARYSLLLIGGADSNLVARRLGAKLPLSTTAESITLGGRKFDAKDACVTAILPNPLNAARYVLAIASTSTDGMFFCAPSNLRNAEFDFRIQDGRMSDGTERIDRNALWIASGWFDRNWQVRDDLSVLGNAEARAKALLLPSPNSAAAPDSTALDLVVGDYDIPNGGPHVTVRRDGARLLTKVGGQSEVVMVPVSKLVYYVVEGPARVVFSADDKGRVTGFEVFQNGQRFGAKRVQ